MSKQEMNREDFLLVSRRADDWLMFDDENVTGVTEEDVLKLSGGGDWHTAYLLIYGPKIFEFEEPSETDATSAETNDSAMDTTSSANGARTSN